MYLVKCPGCKKDIPIETENCPYCGFPATKFGFENDSLVDVLVNKLINFLPREIASEIQKRREIERDLGYFTRKYLEKRRNLIGRSDTQSFSVKNQLSEIENILYRLNARDYQTLNMLRENEAYDRAYALKYWISVTKDDIEWNERAMSDPEGYKPGTMSSSEFTDLCAKAILRSKEHLKRLEAGDYALCKELESQQREC